MQVDNFSKCTIFVICLFYSKGDQYLLWLVHHIAVDLWSMVVLLSELQSIYSFYYTNDSIYSLTIPKMQYYHSVAEQSKVIENEECWAFWQRQLAVYYFHILFFNLGTTSSASIAFRFSKTTCSNI